MSEIGEYLMRKEGIGEYVAYAITRGKVNCPMVICHAIL